MLEKKIFIGGLDKDAEDRLVREGDYRHMLNGRTSLTGVTENIPSNIKIDFILPIGVNKTIGSFEDKLNDVTIYFVANNNDEDLILEYDGRAQVITEILRGDLGLDPEYLINDIDRIEDLLLWNDTNNAPRKINIEKAKAGFYTVNEQALSAVKYAPNCPPDVEYQSSPTSGSSNIRGKLFQFRYKWVYTDGEESAWGPISYVPIPNSEYIYYAFGDQPSSVDNEIKVTLETGTYLVDRIKVAVRTVADSDAPGDFYLIADLDKSEMSIADDSFYDFLYDGEEPSTPIALADSNRLYDFMPLKADSQEVTESNRVMYGGVTEGYDNIRINATASPLYIDRPEETDIASTPAQDAVHAPIGLTLGKLSPSTFTLSGTPREGDIVNFRVSLRIGSINRIDTVSYLVQAGDTYADIINGLSTLVANSSSLNPAPVTKLWKATETSSATYSITAQFGSSINFGGAGLTNWYTELIPTGTTGNFEVRTWSRLFTINPASGAMIYQNAHSSFGSVNNGLVDVELVNWISISLVASNPIRPTKVFKSGSQHQLGIVYYDAANRSGTVQQNKGLSFETDFFNNARLNGINGVNVIVNHQPPEWAVKWQLVYPGRASVGRFVQTRLSIVNAGSNGEFFASLDDLTDYNDDINGVINYDFAKGDRLRVILDTSDEYIDNIVDVEIVSYDTTSNEITFKGSDTFDMTTAKFVELYAPRDEQVEDVYYEIGRAYPVRNPGTSTRAHGTNGESNFGYIDTDQAIGIQPASLHIFNSGDTYYKERSFDVKTATPDTYCVEEDNYSDFYSSSAWDRGRPNREDKDFAQRKFEARVRYTDQLVEDTVINGSSTIQDTYFRDYDQSYGSIKKMYAEDTHLILFHELKVFKSLINEDLLYNSSGTPNGVVGQQNQVISKAIAYSGEYGIGCNPESFAVYGKRKYFIDAERGAVLRLGLEGITPISRTGMQKYFSQKMRDLLELDKDFNAFGGYDVENGEYVLSFEEQTQVVPSEIERDTDVIEVVIPGETLAYNDVSKVWSHFYSFLPDYISGSMVEMVTFKDGEFYRHPLVNDSRNNFYGVDYPMQLIFVANKKPSDTKVFNGIFTESTDVFSMPSATTQGGQETELLTTDFVLREGVYYAELLRDKNTPNVTAPLLNGDEMRSYSMEIEIQNDSTEPQKIFAVNVRSFESYLTNY